MSTQLALVTSRISARSEVIGCVNPDTRAIHGSALAVNHGD